MKKVDINFRGYNVTIFKNMASLSFTYKHDNKEIGTNSTFRFNNGEDFLNKLDSHIKESKNVKATEIRLEGNYERPLEIGVSTIK